MSTLTLERASLPAGTSRRIVDQLWPIEREPGPPSPWAADPVGWAERKLHSKLWSKQRQIAEAVRDNRRTAVRACHSAGKSYLGAALACWWIDTHPVGDAFVISTAPSQPQVNSILWREIRRMRRAAHLAGRIPDATPHWYIGDEHGENAQEVAFGRKPQDYQDAEQAMQAFQGIHAPYVLVLIDEASGVPKWLFDAAMTLATGPNDRILAIGNPDRPSSHFAEVCKPGSGWNEIGISVYDTPKFTGEPMPDDVPLVSPEWVEAQITQPGWKPGEPYHTSKILGEFPDVDVDTLFPPKLLKRAVDNDLPGLGRGGFALDVGGDTGGAETVLYRNRDGVIRIADWHGEQAAWTHEDTEETADRVAEVIAPTLCGIAVDVVGVGKGVGDKLRRRGFAVEKFNGGEAPRMRAVSGAQFANRRAEIFWRLREDMEAGLIDLDPDDQLLLKQLGQIRWKTDGKRILIESKDDMRKRGVASPDRADAVAMTLAAPSEQMVAELQEQLDQLRSQPPLTHTSDLLDREM